MSPRRLGQVAFGLAVAAWALAALAVLGQGAADAPSPHQAGGHTLGRTHERALAAGAARLAGLEARPPEVLTRTLAELGSVYPEFTRLLVCDASGRVLAAWPAAAESLVGANDPAEARRATLAAPPFRHVGERSGGATLELGVGVRRAGAEAHDRAPDLYVAGDLPRTSAHAVSHPSGRSGRSTPLWLLLSCVLVAAAALAFVISSKRPS